MKLQQEWAIEWNLSHSHWLSLFILHTKGDDDDDNNNKKRNNKQNRSTINLNSEAR